MLCKRRKLDFQLCGDRWTNSLFSLDEDEVLNGDIYGMISPYLTANFWVSCHRLPLIFPLTWFISGGRTRRSSTGDIMMW